MPAFANSSSTWLSIPHVIGLTNPSGGGGEYAELIFRICATNVGSLGFHFTITIRHPHRSPAPAHAHHLLVAVERSRVKHRSEDAHDEIDALVRHLRHVRRVALLEP